MVGTWEQSAEDAALRKRQTGRVAAAGPQVARLQVKSEGQQ